MKIGKIVLAAIIGAAVAISFADAGDMPKKLDATIQGPFAIYNISDLAQWIPDQTPDGRSPATAPLAAQVGKLICSCVEPDAWGKTATLSVSDDKIIVRCGEKCPPEMLRSIEGLLDQLRETRQLYAEIHYRLVDSDIRDIKGPGGIVTGLTLDRLDHAKEVVAESKILVFNGQEKSLWDRALENLPAVYVQATATADRSHTTVSICESSKPGQSSKPVTFSLPAGATAVYRLGGPESHDWLVLNAKLIQLVAVDVQPSPGAHGKR